MALGERTGPGAMNIPLVLVHVPALVAYVMSEYALQDAFQRRLNACAVLDEFVKFVKHEPNDLRKAVEKCKGVVRCPGSYASKTLAALHDALCKNTPPVDRPIADPEDVCDLAAWNTECSMIRELFGTQLSTGKHVLSFDLEASGNSMAKCLRMFLEKAGDARVCRAPLVMVCTLPVDRFIDYPYEYVFSGVRYVLKVVATPEKTMFVRNDTWFVDTPETPLESLNALVTKDAGVIVYGRY
jgi:hypothetical protein